MSEIQIISATDPFAYIEINEKQKRFAGADWFNPMQETVVSVGGAGGIGSWLTLFLARAGAKVQLHDFDTVEEVNLAGQFYTTESISKPKTEAVIALIQAFGAEGEVTAYGKISKDTDVCDICFSGFDTMEARKHMFEAWKRRPTRRLFIDGRMSAEVFQVFCVTPSTEELYLEDTPSDARVHEEPCTYKATSHTAAACASDMFSLLANYVSNEFNGVDARNLPYHITKNNVLMHINQHDKTENKVQSLKPRADDEEEAFVVSDGLLGSSGNR